MSRIVVHVVSGAGQAERRAWIARSLAARPGWAALTPRACPCCIGRIEAKVQLTRLLRERRPTRVLLELGDAQHLAPLQRILDEPPLAQYLEAGRVIRLPDDERLTVELLGA